MTERDHLMRTASLGALVLVMVLVYCFGPWAIASFEAHHPGHAFYFIDDVRRQWMRSMPDFLYYITEGDWAQVDHSALALDRRH